jgi:hypothetical protein
MESDYCLEEGVESRAAHQQFIHQTYPSARRRKVKDDGANASMERRAAGVRGLGMSRDVNEDVTRACWAHTLVVKTLKCEILRVHQR